MPHAIHLSEAPSVTVASERPWLFGLLIAPSAVIANGVIQGGALAYLMTQQKIGVDRVGQTISLLALPTTLYFLWSPITDFLMRRRNWLLLGGVAAALLMALGLMQPNLVGPLTVAQLFLSACFVQLVVSSCGGMMGAFHLERSKRIAGSFYQAGSLAFGAGSVFVLIQLNEHGHRRWVGPAAMLMTGVPALFALAAPRQPFVQTGSPLATLRHIGQECRSTFLRWSALPYMLVLLFPIGTGSAIGLLPSLAPGFGVSGSQVAWMNGLGGALLMAAGSFAALAIPVRWRPVLTYLGLDALNALAIGVIWLGPQRPITYFAGSILYLFTIGAVYAAFTAVLLEFMGPSGKSGSGRYSIVNSMGNVPIVYLTALEGWGGAHFGLRGVPMVECIAGLAGATVLAALFVIRKPAATQRSEAD